MLVVIVQVSFEYVKDREGILVNEPISFGIVPVNLSLSNHNETEGWNNNKIDGERDERSVV